LLGCEAERIIAAVIVILNKNEIFPVRTLFAIHEQYCVLQYSCCRLYIKFLCKQQKTEVP